MSLVTGSYAALSGRLHERSSLQRVPIGVSVEVSHRCPLRCVHCYNNQPMASGRSASELSLAEYDRILGELAEAGCLWLLFTGGEILARPDFLEIHSRAVRLGFLVTLFSNGTLVSERVADQLAEWRPFAIEVTLYGRTRRTYEAVTRVPGSFERCLAGIERLRVRRLPLELKTVALTTNRHEVAAMREYAAGLGVPFKLDTVVNPRTDCSRSPLEVRLTPEEAVAIDLSTAEYRAAWEDFAERFTGPAHPPGTVPRLYDCGGAVDSFAIDPTGRMTVCVLSQAEAYDLRKGSVREGWERFLGGVCARRAARETRCTRCRIKAACGMCPANGELENGDAESPVDYLCHTAHLRSYAMEAVVPPHGACEYCPGGARHAQLQAELVGLRQGR